MVIKFKFNIEDKVTTSFGEEGIIKDMIGFETNNNRCFIRTATSARWVNENSLKLIKIEEEDL